MGAPVQFNATPVSACSRCLSWVGSLCVQFHHWQLRRSSSALPVSLKPEPPCPFLLPSSGPHQRQRHMREAPAPGVWGTHLHAHTAWASGAASGHRTGRDCYRTGWGRHGWHVSQRQQQGASGAQMGQAGGGACCGWMGEQLPGPPSLALFHCTSAMPPHRLQPRFQPLLAPTMLILSVQPWQRREAGPQAGGGSWHIP